MSYVSDMGHVAFNDDCVPHFSARQESPTINQQVGFRIKTARLRAGLSQDELAKAISLSRTAVINIEAGRQNIYFHTVLAIAIATGTPIKHFIPTDFSELIFRE